MNTLVCSGLASPLGTKRASLWMETSPTLHSTSIQDPQNFLDNSSSSTRTRELQARAKGFGEVITISDKKRKQEEDASNNNNKSGNEDDDAIPQVVFERMIFRILFYVGIPMVSGVGLVYLFSILKDQHLWDVPLWLPFLTSLLAFGTSALGIAYGTLSSSWDPEKKGSLLGWEEAQQNWPELWREDEEKR
ncbi:transmembrane protein, putative (DUF3464) [Tasmannia lanceolata]|uniref:transmembrane protein, putative (DUF3464) n=1 Tax=Tasmannia lanceolata TaxID=3420 RepID=UPI0040637365